MARYRATSPLSPPVRLDTGALRVEALVPPGVQTYDVNGQRVREYVAPEELQAPDYVDGLAGLPVLFREGKHPGTSDGIVSVDDLGGARQIGTLLGQRWTDGGQALAMALDAPDAEDIARRYPYVSVGYRADRDRKPGTAPDGTPYDVRQVRRRQPNHVVLTHAPRAGYAAAVRLDADDTDTPATPDGDPMEEALAKLMAMIEALAADVAALRKAPEAPEVEPVMDSKPRMDTMDDVLAIQSAAADLGVVLDPKATVDDARKAVAAKLVETHSGIRLDAEADSDARQLAIGTFVASRPSQAERIARMGATRLDTHSEGTRPRMTQ